MTRGLGYVLVLILLCQSSLAIAEKVYRHSFSATPRTLDPTAYADLYADKLAGQVYDSLYDFRYLKMPAELKPRLAETLPKISSDGLRLLIPIKRGVFFADDPCFPNGVGREVLAEDFVFSLKRHFDPKTMSANKWFWVNKIVGLDEWGESGADYSKLVPGLRAVDCYTIQVLLKRPYSQFVHTLAMATSAVIPREAVARYGQEISIHPVGSGAWKLLSFDNSKAVFVKNPRFREEFFDPLAEGYDENLHGFTGIKKLAGKKVPIVDRVEVSFVEQETARWNSFTKGSEIQFATVPTLEFAQIVKSAEPLTLHKVFANQYIGSKNLEPAYVYFGFNMQDPDIGTHKDPERNAQNRALRCAIRKAFNWKQLIERIHYGLGEPFPGIVPPNIQGFDSTLSKDSITLDIDGARKLLQQSGWTAARLPILRFSGVSSIRNKQIYEMFKAWMIKIGYPAHKIKFEISAQFGDYVKALREGKLMTFSLFWSFDYPDAQNSFQLYYGPNISPGSNTANYQNPDYDQLYEQTVTLMPGPERQAIYRKLTKILIDDCVVVAGFVRTHLYLWHKNVIMHPTEYLHGDYFKFIDVEAQQ